MQCKSGTCTGEVTRGLKLAFHAAEVPFPCNQHRQCATCMTAAPESANTSKERGPYVMLVMQQSWWQQDYWRLLQPKLWVTQSGTAHHAGTEQLIRYSCEHTSAGAASARPSGWISACQTPGRPAGERQQLPKQPRIHEHNQRRYWRLPALAPHPHQQGKTQITVQNVPS